MQWTKKGCGVEEIVRNLNVYCTKYLLKNCTKSVFRTGTLPSKLSHRQRWRDVLTELLYHLHWVYNRSKHVSNLRILSFHLLHIIEQSFFIYWTSLDTQFSSTGNYLTFSFKLLDIIGYKVFLYRILVSVNNYLQVTAYDLLCVLILYMNLIIHPFPSITQISATNPSEGKVAVSFFCRAKHYNLNRPNINWK